MAILSSFLLLVPCLLTMGCGILCALWLKSAVSSTSPVWICSAAIIVGTGSALYLQGSFLHTIFLMGASIYGLLPLSFVAGAIVWRALRLKKDVNLSIRRASVLWLPCVAALILSASLGKVIRVWRVDSTRAYVVQIVPLLDEVRVKTGSFPTALSQLALAPSPWSAYPLSYTAEKGEFRFAYDDPARIFGASEFSNANRVWHDYQ